MIITELGSNQDRQDSADDNPLPLLAVVVHDAAAHQRLLTKELERRVYVVADVEVVRKRIWRKPACMQSCRASSSDDQISACRASPASLDTRRRCGAQRCTRIAHRRRSSSSPPRSC